MDRLAGRTRGNARPSRRISAQEIAAGANREGPQRTGRGLGAASPAGHFLRDHAAEEHYAACVLAVPVRCHAYGSCARVESGTAVSKSAQCGHPQCDLCWRRSCSTSLVIEEIGKLHVCELCKVRAINLAYEAACSWGTSMSNLEAPCGKGGLL